MFRDFRAKGGIHEAVIVQSVIYKPETQLVRVAGRKRNVIEKYDRSDEAGTQAS